MSPRRENDYALAFGRALEEQMSKRSVTQAGLARALEFSPAYVNRLVTGSAGAPSPDRVDLIADKLEVGEGERWRLHMAAAIAKGYKLRRS